jgi:hypothetical protein
LMWTVTLTALVLAAGCAGRCNDPSRAFLRFDRSVPFRNCARHGPVAVATITVMIAVHHQEQRQQRCACPCTGNGGVMVVVCWYRSSSSSRHHHHHRQVAMIAACDGRWRPTESLATAPLRA